MTQAQENAQAHPDAKALKAIGERQMQNFGSQQIIYRLWTVITGFIVVLILVLLNIFELNRQSEEAYYITVNDQYQYLPPTPLHEPIYSDNTIKTKALQMTSSILTMDYVNYVQQINEKRYLFTEAGWQSFEKALESSEILLAIKSRDMLIKFKPKETPVVLKKGVLMKDLNPADNGKYSWQVEMTGEILTQRTNPKTNKREAISSKAVIRMVIIREGLHRYQNGLAIKQMIVRIL